VFHVVVEAVQCAIIIGYIENVFVKLSQFKSFVQMEKSTITFTALGLEVRFLSVITSYPTF
jgi:hypothetical protein